MLLLQNTYRNYSIPCNNSKLGFKGYESLIPKGNTADGISGAFNKTLSKIKKRYTRNGSYDVLVFRDGKVVCAQLGFSDKYKAKHKLVALDCDHCYAYENATGNGSKLYTELIKKYNAFKLKYKNLHKKN